MGLGPPHPVKDPYNDMGVRSPPLRAPIGIWGWGPPLRTPIGMWGWESPLRTPICRPPSPVKDPHWDMGLGPPP